MLRLFKSFVVLGLLFSQCAMAFDQVVVFGDSLSDNGNFFAITKDLHKVVPLVPLMPKPGVYWEGRFSNGPVWDEVLAQNLGFDLSDEHQYRNYAYGGAWVERITEGRNYRDVVPNLKDQVEVMYRTHLLLYPSDKLQQHLFLVWGGANDYLSGRTDVDKATSQTVAGLKDILGFLLDRGAQYAVVMDLPDLSQTTYAKLAGADYIENVHALSQAHNQKLHAMAEQLRIKYPNAHIVVFPVSDFFQQVIDDPASFGLKDASSCYLGSYTLSAAMSQHQQSSLQIAEQQGLPIAQNPALQVAYGLQFASSQNACADPNAHVFFDKVHPSARVHETLARLVQEKLYF